MSQLTRLLLHKWILWTKIDRPHPNTESLNESLTESLAESPHQCHALMSSFSFITILHDHALWTWHWSLCAATIFLRNAKTGAQFKKIQYPRGAHTLNILNIGQPEILSFAAANQNAAKPSVIRVARCNLVVIRNSKNLQLPRSS